MTNAEWCIKNGIKFRKVGSRPCFGSEYESIGYYDINGHFHECYKGKRLGSYELESILTWLDMEHKEPILDEAERKYLSAVIRPFRDEIHEIAKHNVTNGKYQWIDFIGKDEYAGFYLPNFKAGTMYKGMEVGRKYTLEELGL